MSVGAVTLAGTPVVLGRLWRLRASEGDRNGVAGDKPPRYGLGRVAGVIESLLTGLAAYSRVPGSLLIAVLQALGFQGLVTLSNYCAALSVGVELPIMGLAWIVAVVSLVHLLPISLAGLGVREGAYAILLQQYGIPLPQGVSLSLCVFAIILAQALIGGLVELIWSLPSRYEGHA